MAWKRSVFPKGNIYSWCLLWLVTASSVLRASPSADTLTTADNSEIRMLAQRKVEKGLSDLLNTITFEDLGEFERKAIIADSYGNSNNKLFYNEQVVIEDDINPEHSASGKTADFKVEKYLSSLDLFYGKSADRTIELSDFQVSNTKKADYYFVKIYFKSLFKAQHNQLKTPYTQLARVAEVRAEKKEKKWVTYISGISFASPQDSANATLNDVVLLADSAKAMQPEEEKARISSELARQKEREAEQKALVEYNKLLTLGDQAFAAKDYEKALEAYNEAEKRNDFDDLLPKRKIYQVKQALQKEKQTSGELLKLYLAKGSVAQKTRNYTEAISFYKKALEIKPDSAALLEILKNLNLKSSKRTELDEKYNSGQYAELIKDYNRILKQEKDDSDHYLGRGLAYTMTNDQERALKDFSQAIALDFSNLAALKARAELWTRKKDYPKAIADMTAYLNIDEKDADILLRRAKLKIQTHNNAGAKEDFDRAVLLYPQNKSYLFDRGNFVFEQGKFLDAISDFTQIIALDNGHTDARYMRGLSFVKMNEAGSAGRDFAVLKKGAITKEQEAEVTRLANEYFAKGLLQQEQKKYKDAITQYDNAIHITSDMATSWFRRGACYLMLGDTLMAIESYDIAIKQDPKYDEALYERGKIWFGLKKYEQAVKDYSKAGEANPANYHAFAGEGEALFALKKYEEAKVPLEFLKTNEKKIGLSFTEMEYARTYNLLGSSLFRTKKYEEAVEEFYRAIEKDKNFSDAYANRAEVYETGNNLKKAIPDYRKASELDPENICKILRTGVAMRKNESYRDAISLLSIVVEKDSLNACCKSEAMLARAECYFALEQYTNAAADYTNLFRMDSTARTPESLVNTGVSFLHQKQPEKALAFLSLVSHQDKLKWQSYYRMGCGYLMKKNEAEALKWFERSFQTGMVTRAYVRKDRMLADIDKAFAGSLAFKNLIDKNLIK